MFFLKKNYLWNKLLRVKDAALIFLKYSTPRKAHNLISCYLGYIFSRHRLSAYPFKATIDPGNICNLRCFFCSTGAWQAEVKAQFLSYDDFREIISAIGKNLYLISLFLSGEPFLNKDILRMVRLAREHKIPCFIHTNLNIPIDRTFADRIVESGLEYLSVSLDGATQHTYGKYRINGNLGLAMKNIHLINDAKNRLRIKTPVLIWQYLLFRRNEHELSQAAGLARERGMRFRVVAPDCALEEESSYAAHGHSFVRRGKCSFLWTTLHLTSSLKLIPCCQLISDKYSLGELSVNKFHEQWNSLEYQNARRDLGYSLRQEENKIRSACIHCKQNHLWRFLHKNNQ